MPGRRALAALARRVEPRAAFPARAFSSFGGAPATTTTRPLRGSSGSAGASHPPRRSYASASSPEPSSSCLFARSLSALGDRHAPLASWLAPRLDASANGFAHPSLEARSVPGAGVGVFAAAPIPEGTAVLRVPRGAFEPLSAEYAVRTARRRAPPFVAHVERVAASAGAPAFATHALFATHLCFEAFSSASADESAHQSPLRPYLASLPKLEGPEARAWGPSVPALWDDAQLETLRGTPTRAAVARRIRFVAEMHAAIFGGGASGSSSASSSPLSTTTTAGSLRLLGAKMGASGFFGFGGAAAGAGAGAAAASAGGAASASAGGATLAFFLRGLKKSFILELRAPLPLANELRAPLPINGRGTP